VIFRGPGGPRFHPRRAKRRRSLDIAEAPGQRLAGRHRAIGCGCVRDVRFGDLRTEVPLGQGCHGDAACAPGGSCAALIRSRVDGWCRSKE
jgi:hypothetical protein